MQRGTATVLVVIGAVALLIGFWLSVSEVTTSTGGCGTALSPSTDSYDPFASEAENIVNGLSAESGCKDAIAGRRWFAVVVGLGGVVALVLGGQGLNATSAEGDQAASL